MSIEARLEAAQERSNTGHVVRLIRDKTPASWIVYNFRRERLKRRVFAEACSAAANAIKYDPTRVTEYRRLIKGAKDILGGE